MGVDLAMLIPDRQEMAGMLMTMAEMEIARSAIIHHAIASINSSTVRPAALKSYRSSLLNGEPTYGRLDGDKYCVPLRWVTAGSITDALKVPLARYPLENGHADCQTTRAALEYIAALPRDWPVILYWH